MKTATLVFIVLLLTFQFATAQIIVNAGLTNNDIQVFFINDFNLIQSGASPQLFWLTLTNNYPTSKMVKLRLVFQYNSASAVASSELLSGTSDPFLLPVGPLYITNQSLFSSTNDYGLQDYNFNEDAANDLMESILSTGKLPSGSYQFVITVIEDVTTTVYDEEILEFNISNPTTLDLLFPGEPARMSDMLPIYTTLPLFRWESDASEFRIRVCERLSINSSPEDVMENEPRLEVVLNTTTFNYPPAAFPLEEGKTYFWQVMAIVNSSNGPIEYPSEIWGFKIANLTSGQFTATHMQAINYLMLILGSDFLTELFDEGGELANYSFNGTIINNGSSLSLEELTNLINKIFRGEIKIKGYVIE